jgi:hypothetical protein
MPNTIKHTRSFIAISANGKEYIINEFTEFVDFGNSQGRGSLPGYKSLETRSGEPVNLISKGHYKLVFSGIELTSDDPDAP